MALRKVGSKPILSADELTTPTSKEARVCLEFYASTRDTVLRSYPWNSALSRAELAQDTATPAFGFAYQYPLPADCLRVMQMENQQSVFKVEQRRLLTDEVEPKIIYIARVIDPSLWDPLLVEAVYVSLAVKIAMALAKDPNLAETLLTELERVIMPRARRYDAQEGGPETIYARTLLDARLQYSGSNLRWP